MPIAIGSGVLYEESTTGSGTGNYDSFLRLQANGDEEGFNTDDGHEADNKDGIWTHSVLVSDLVMVDIGGTLYYEIRLDLNEGNAAGDPAITLEELRLFRSDAPADGTDLDNDFVDLTEVFDLGSALNLTDINSGSGTDDYRFLIPVTLFPDTDQYFTLYSVFDGSDGGFEEWRALANETGTDGLPVINLVKTALPTSFDEGTPTNVAFTYTLTSGSSNTDPLTLVSFIDDNATPGNSSDDINLLLNASGTYLGDYYLSGDTNGDGLLQNTETWTFSVTVNGLDLNAGTTRTNIAEVFAQDDEGNSVDDLDDAIVTANDVLPAITLVKTANVSTISEGVATDIIYTYTLTSQSADTDPLTINTLIDDNGTSGLGEEGDDINLLAGVDAANPLGIYYVSGDADNDELLDSDETWVFNYTVQDVVLNGGQTRTNVADVTAQDDEGNPVSDDDDATVTGQDVLPAINIVKEASETSIQAGSPTLVTFTYSLTNTSTSPLDPLTLTSLVDDNGTLLNLFDDINLLEGVDAANPLGIHYVSGDTDGDELLEIGETWIFDYDVTMTLAPGETRTNIVTVNAVDDEGSSASDTDDAAVTAFNLGRTPGFWSNNGSRLWDGDPGTFPKAGGLGIVLPGNDLAYAIHDLDANGSGENAVGSTQYLMIGDWNKNGIADPDENVLLITRSDALSLLNSSLKQQQDGRYVLARDLVASWLNFLGGSYVGESDDPNSAMHYIDEATAWLMETTSGDHIFTRSELTPGTKEAQWDDPWQDGFNFDGDGMIGENVAPATGHDIGEDFSIDILAGSAIHSALDHFNNHGWI